MKAISEHLSRPEWKLEG